MNDLLYGFSIALTWQNLLAAFGGALIGTAVGVLPGIGPSSAMAILLPATLGLEPATSLIMLAGIFYGSQYGGSTTAILLNMPGESTALITCRDGYQMALKGRAGAALAISGVGSFIAGTAGVVGLTFATTAIAEAALAFGPPEYFCLALLGLAVLSRLSTAAPWKNALLLALGALLATVGQDPLTGEGRFTLGITELMAGISLVPVLMGVYGVSEVLAVIQRSAGFPKMIEVKFRELFPTAREWRASAGPIARGTLLGFPLGLIPGPAALISTYLSYALEKRVSKHPEQFGQGAIEGVAGPESANNAATSGTLAPLLALGLPFTGATALLLAGMTIHGIQPGPLLVTQHPEIFWGVIASMYIGNVALLILNVPLVGLWVSLLRVPQALLVCLILVFTVVGAYSVRNSVADIYVLLGSGVIGYLLVALKFDMAPLILGMVLGPVMEENLRRSLFQSDGNLLIFVTSRLSIGMMTMLVLVLLGPPCYRLVRDRMPQS